MKDKKRSSILENVLLAALVLIVLYKVFLGGNGCAIPNNLGVPDHLTQNQQVQTKD